MKGIFLALLAIILTVTGFTQDQALKDYTPEGKWILKSLQIEGQLKDVLAGAFQIEFGNNGQMSAKICNRLGGNFTIKGNTISFAPIRSTKMMCSEMKYESAFSQAIMEADTIEYNRNEMTLKKGKETVMVLSMPVN